MDGIDTTWARVPGGAEIGSMVEKAIADFKKDDPGASVPALLAIRAKLATIASDPVVDDKRSQLDRILRACLGLKVETNAMQPEVVPGEKVSLRHNVSVQAAIPVRWTRTRARGLENAPSAVDLASGKSKVGESSLTVPKDLPMTQPYWLREEGSSGIFRVDDPKLIGTPENAPALPLEYVFEIGGQTLIVNDEPIYLEQAAGKERRRRLDIIPPVWLKFASDVSLFRPGASRSVIVEIHAMRVGQSGSVRFETPAGWKLNPSEKMFSLSKSGDKATFSVNITAPDRPSSDRVTASVWIDGQRFSNQRIAIDYAHLPFMLLQPTARARVVSADYAIRGKNVGYLPGAGDSVADALGELGYAVTKLTGADLVPEKLAGLDAVVIGVRAFNERKDLAAGITNLFAFAENGGVVIVQYNRPNGLKTQTLGPYPLSIQGPAPQLRVTDERAPVEFLAPESDVLNKPNRIGPADFDGWFQERGSYFPSSWDKEHYQTILAMSDPGEEPLKSAILVAKHGKGFYVYTGVTFFRQLPAGVSGAYRLFANLVSLGK
jgi:hypothetical protein